MKTLMINGSNVWSATCSKIMTRYTCVFLPRILATFSALWVFFPKYGSIFFSCVRSTQTYSKQARICLRITRTHIYTYFRGCCRGGRRVAVVERRLHDRKELWFPYFTISSSRGAKLILLYERPTGPGLNMTVHQKFRNIAFHSPFTNP